MIAPILKVERKLGETVFYVCFMTFVLNLVDYLSNFLGPQFNEYSHLSNNRGGWNKRVGVQKDAKSTGLFPSIFMLE